MSTTLSDIFAAPTSGYKEGVGSWDIHIGVPDNRSAASLNTLTRDMVQAFLAAFGSLCTVVEMLYDTIAFDTDGGVERVDEGRRKSIDKGKPEDILGELRAALPDDQDSFFTALFLHCDVRVFAPYTRRIVRAPRAIVFYLGFVLEYDEAGLLEPVDGSMSVSTSIDVWAPRTRDLAEGRWQDNSIYAKYNRPRLARALEEWERLVDKPIIEWHSRYYHDQIARHGFKAG